MPQTSDYALFAEGWGSRYWEYTNTKNIGVDASLTDSTPSVLSTVYIYTGNTTAPFNKADLP